MDKEFTALNDIKIPRPFQILKIILITSLILLLAILTITPWRQTAAGLGYLTAFNPNDRTQEIHATVGGRIKKWFVQDGSTVKAGDKIVEIADNDPLIVERLLSEKMAKERKMQVARIAAETSKLNYGRQENLFNRGLASRKNFEDAKIEYQKLLAAKESAAAEAAEIATKVSRQESQLITAPCDGTILKLLAGGSSTTVKSGDKIASIAPNLSEPAIELYVSGNDIPLIYQGRKVRLQFEGWPAIQFSGWPEVAVGTFGGVIKSVDLSVSDNGKFRVIVMQDKNEKWPEARFLKHGTRVYGWILLNEVQLGYELWRQINGFPPSFDNIIAKKKQILESK